MPDSSMHKNRRVMKRIYIILSAMFAFSYAASAQDSQSTFFLDNYAFNYRINPAIMSEKNFVGLGVGNISVDISSPIGINSLFFPTENGLVTGFNRTVPSEKFLAGFRDLSTFSNSDCINLVSFGTRLEKVMFTVEMNLRVAADASIPKDCFSFLKNGFDANTTYNFSNLHASAKSYAEIVGGYAQTIGSKLTVGGRIKALVGLVNADIAIDRADFIASEQSLVLDTDVSARIAVPAPSNGVPTTAVSTVSIGGLSIASGNSAGLGFALDLGATYELIEGLTLSASIRDLGFMNWKYADIASESVHLEFTGFSGLDAEGGAIIDDNVRQIGDRIKDFDFEELNSRGRIYESSMLPFTATAGARWVIPGVNFIRVGALATFHTEKYSTWFDFRTGATLTPTRWLSAGANIGIGSLGPICGFAASINLACVNIFVSVDSTFGPMGQGKIDEMPVTYPLGPSRYTANLGMTIQFGERHLN